MNKGNKQEAVNAIREAIKALSPIDAPIVKESVVLGDPWGWGAEVATINVENGLEFLDYYNSDWILNSLKIQDWVREKYGFKIFIECYNAAIHNVYWDT